MKLKLFPKVFLYSLSIMLFITLIAHILIFFIAPTQNMLITSNYLTNVGTTSYAEVDMQQLITSTILKSFPLSFIGCVVISLIFSFLFSRGITSPILLMGKTVDKMMVLDPSAQIPVETSDEIGILAKNINELYGSLLSTIRNLEKEKENVSIAEREKSDFLRMASHELKTPVTELNATLENMILGIGEYRDYDLYLPKCKEITTQLGKMITDILSTSRLQIDADMDLTHDFSLKEFLLEVCEPFRLIAETKNISFELSIENNMSLHLPEKLLKKAISNILLNAVNYTEAGKHIAVQVSAKTLSVTNECNPIPHEHLAHIFEPFYRPDYSRNQETGGNGFGLYIVETILRKMGLSYRFIPLVSNDGMTFIIEF